MSDDIRVMVCNRRTDGPSVSGGAKCYVFHGWWGGGLERLQILAKSRGGRWISKWEGLRNLENFRTATLPPEHPARRARSTAVFRESDGWISPDASHAARLNAVSDAMAAGVTFEAANRAFSAGKLNAPAEPAEEG